MTKHITTSLRAGLLFMLMFSAAGAEPVYIDLPDTARLCSVQEPFIVVTMNDGSLRIFDTTGSELSHVEVEMQLPVDPYASEAGVEADSLPCGAHTLYATNNLCVVFPQSRKLLIARHKLEYFSQSIWQSLKRLLYAAFVRGTDLELYDIESGQLLESGHTWGMLGDRCEDTSLALLAFHTSGEEGGYVNVLDMSGRHELVRKSVGPSIEDLWFFEGCLYVLKDDFLMWIEEDSLWSEALVQQAPLPKLPGPLYRPTFRTHDDSGRVYIFNNSVTDSLGPLHWLSNDSLSQICQEAVYAAWDRPCNTSYTEWYMSPSALLLHFDGSDSVLIADYEADSAEWYARTEYEALTGDRRLHFPNGTYGWFDMSGIVRLRYQTGLIEKVE